MIFVRDFTDRTANSTTANAAYHDSLGVSFPPLPSRRPFSPPTTTPYNLISSTRSTFTGYSTFVYLYDKYSLRVPIACACRAFSFPSTFVRQLRYVFSSYTRPSENGPRLCCYDGRPSIFRKTLVRFAD